jgi:hypothetical protein
MATPKFYDIHNDNDALHFGLSPTKPTPNSNGVPARDFLLSRCYPGRQGAKPRFIVLHTQGGLKTVGTTAGSLEHWVAGTYKGKDGNRYPIEASATVTVQEEGSILRVIPEEHGPWTNGQVKKPTAQSAQLRALAGAGSVNIHCLTIEAEGGPNDVMPEPELRAIVWQVRDWMDRYDIPLDNILPHSSIDSVDRGFCPGPYYHRVMVTFGRYPEPSPPPPYNGKPKTINDVVFHPFKQQVTSTGVNQRLWANRAAPLVGPLIPAGQKIQALYWVRSEKVEGNDIWLVEESGPRIWSGGVAEAVP